MKKLNLGVIGTGLAARRLHLPAIKALRDRVRVVACANRSVDKAWAFAKELPGCVVEPTPEALLARRDVEAVLVCLPIELNAAWALKALKAGKRVLAEKPIAADRESAAALERAARGRLLVAENYLFWPHMAAAVDIVRRGRLGSVRLAVVHHIQDARAAGEWLTPWRVKPRFAGGFVLDGGVHWAALLNAMLGVPVEVLARPALADRSLPPIDTAAAIVRYRDGARAVWATAYSAKAGAEPLLSVHGDKGSLAIGWDATLWRDERGRERKLMSPMASYEAQLRHFHHGCTTATPFAYTPRQARADLDLALRVCGQ